MFSNKSPAYCEENYAIPGKRVMNYYLGVFVHNVSSTSQTPFSIRGKPNDENLIRLSDIIMKSTMMGNNEYRLVNELEHGRYRQRQHVSNTKFLETIMFYSVDYFNKCEIPYQCLHQLRKCCDDISIEQFNSTPIVYSSNDLLERRFSWLESIGTELEEPFKWMNTFSIDGSKEIKYLYSNTLAIIFKNHSNIEDCGMEIRHSILTLLENHLEIEKSVWLKHFKHIIVICNNIAYHFCICITDERNLNVFVYDSGFQDMVHRNRSKLYLHDCVSYFMMKRNFDRTQHLSKLKIEDLLKIMVKTSGYSSFSPCKGVTLCDTGGQRTERRKWGKIVSDLGSNVIPCLVVSLAEFDEVCYEDDATNRYRESLACFQEEFFKKRDLIILFSKYEVLKRKVEEGVRFSNYDPDFIGDDSNVEQVRDYIIGKYVELDTEKKIRKIIVINSAFDFIELQHVFNEITESNLFDSYFDSYLKKISHEKLNMTNNSESIQLTVEKWTARPLLEDEILQITDFLEMDDLFSMNLVCKMWNNVTYRSGLNLRRPNLDLFLKTDYEYVKSLNLQARFVQKRHIEAIATHPRFLPLEYLDLSNNYILKQEDYEYLFGMCEFRHLKTLLLDYGNLNSLTFLLNSPTLKLKAISLNGVSQITTNQVIELIKSPCCENLTEINTKNCKMILSQQLEKELKKQFYTNHSFTFNFQPLL